MQRLSNSEKEELIRLLSDGDPLPGQWGHRLFPAGSRTAAVGKEYRLVYDGKLTREEVLAQTPTAPWQLERSFCVDRPHGDGWRNLLVWGDNLLALRELLADQQGPNRLGTRGKIKLIYIDPPFATRQDFMKDREKAYRDKVLGAQFIEFLRRRLILLYEILADDGTIYVHLDQKKGHYLKAILDEVFGETNFRNEVIWYYRRYTAKSSSFQSLHDTIYRYTKTDDYVFNDLWEPYSDTAGKRDSHYKQDEDGQWYRLQKRAGQKPYKVYLNEKGKRIGDVWELQHVNASASERTGYPTQKPEELIERVITASSNVGDIVIDCFAGSGSVAAVAEKTGRRWIAMDCGKLAIYTTLKRIFTLTKIIGPAKKDDRAEQQRVNDWEEHLKGAPSLLLITEKARNGECDVTLDLLHDLAALAYKHHLVKKGGALSLVCPETKLRIPKDQFQEPGDGSRDEAHRN
jgi:DNA modification methylase